jgi:hypothetical protein
MIPDIERFIGNLKLDLAAQTRAWFIDCADGETYTIIEDDKTGRLLGSLWGRKPER